MRHRHKTLLRDKLAGFTAYAIRLVLDPHQCGLKMLYELHLTLCQSTGLFLVKDSRSLFKHLEIPLSDTPCTVAPQCAATVSRLTCRPRIRHTIVRHATPHCMASRWRTNLNRGIGRLFFVVVEAAHLFAAGELVVDCEHKRVVGA